MTLKTLNVPALVALCDKTTMSTHCHMFMFEFMGKVYLIYEKRLCKKLFRYGCHDTSQGQKTRATNEGRKMNTLWYPLRGKTMSRYYYGNCI